MLWTARRIRTNDDDDDDGDTRADGSERARKRMRGRAASRERGRACLLAAVPALTLALVLVVLAAQAPTRVSAWFINPVDGLHDQFDFGPGFTLHAAIERRERPAHLAQAFGRRDYSALDAADPVLARIPKLADPALSIDHRQAGSFLSKILIPRVPGTENNTRVQRTIADVFERELAPKPSSPHGAARSGWTLERQTFEAQTPEGKRTFTNLIATKEPDAPRKLMLAAHFDSKFFRTGSPNEGFIGATDSAAPCAMLVDVVRAVDALLDRRAETRRLRQGSIAADTTLQIVFFDGEEAFHDWTHSDSIYGARALAFNWSEPVLPHAARVQRQQNARDSTEGEGQEDGEEGEGGAEGKKKGAVPLEGRRYTPASSTPIKPIDTIEHMVLLDLLGAPNPTVPNYFEHTGWLYDRFVEAERKLRDGGLMLWSKEEATKGKTFFGQRFSYGGIEDDHIPFAARGVPIFHLITSPFPSVWHRASDDASALDYPTMYAWSMLMRLFVIEYLGLAPYIEATAA